MSTGRLKWKERVRTLDAVFPQEHLLSEALEILTSGGVIVFPTISLYGLGADAENLQAVEKIFDIKNRPFHKPLLVLVPNMECLSNMVRDIPSCAEKLMTRFWPGGLTLVFEADNRILSHLSAGTGKIGIRMPQHPVAKELCKRMGRAITATSANLSGKPGCDSIARLDNEVADNVDLIIDSGTLRGGAGSTVVDVTVNPPRILREGTIPAGLVFDAL